MSELLDYLGVGSLDQASDLISENSDPDAFVIEENGEFVLRMSSRGTLLDFPMSVDDFWELVRDLEDDVITALESDPGAEC